MGDSTLLTQHNHHKTQHSQNNPGTHFRNTPFTMDTNDDLTVMRSDAFQHFPVKEKLEILKRIGEETVGKMPEVQWATPLKFETSPLNEWFDQNTIPGCQTTMYTSQQLPKQYQRVKVLSQSRGVWLDGTVMNLVKDRVVRGHTLHQTEVVVQCDDTCTRWVDTKTLWMLRLKSDQNTRRLAASDAPVLAAPNLGLLSVTLAIGGYILYRAFRGCLRKRRPEYILPIHDENALRFPTHDDMG